MVSQKEKLIPERFIPEKGSEVEIIDGKPYLISNDAMYTFYKRTKGEFSAFFLALRDEKRLLGCRCTKCGLIRVPPFLTHCPECNFAPVETVEVEQVGVLNSTPPITYFATALFQDMAPYGRGRVIFRGAHTAMSVNLYTTTGILVPGLIRKGTEVKLVFRDQRIGEMSDVFCVPTSELSPAQIQTNGLQESAIDWETPREPELAAPSRQDTALFDESLSALKAIIHDMNRNERARKDIGGWQRNILVKTRGGQFRLILDNGNIEVHEGTDGPADFVMVTEDLRVLLDGLAYRGAITDSVINGKIWISKNMEFNTIFKLDRMARSLARTKKR